MALEDAAASQGVSYNQQIYIAIWRRLAVSARAKQDDHLRVKGCHDVVSNLVQQVICDRCVGNAHHSSTLIFTQKR